ncbi:MAG: type I methionyl aminopeptidase [Chloroflexi bacterium]|nr:type I methionyl aminopeptidase [Chloroflexota bacterium]
MAWERTIVLKSKQEIDVMREAGRINAMALQATRELIRPGVTTAELDAVAEEVIRDHGAEPAFLGYPGATPYPGTINASVNDELVHGLPRDRKLKEGDIISIDCGTVYEEFIADSAFTLGVGEISKEAQQLLEVTEKALWIGIDYMRPGNRVGDISAAIQEYVEEFGYNVPREYSGHGVGRKMHEGPQVPNYGLPGRGLALRPGITIALEPMVMAGSARTKVLSDGWTVSSADGSLTAHFEHSVAVTDDEPIILTAFDE